MITLHPKLFWDSYLQANETREVNVLENVEPALKVWLEENILHEELLKLLFEFPFVEEVQLCANYFYGPVRIQEETEKFNTIDASYIVIGSACNGDWIAIPRVSWNQIGYISHDEFGYDQTDQVNYCPVSRSLGEFYYNTWNVSGYPCDYYEAVEYVSKRDSRE